MSATPRKLYLVLSVAEIAKLNRAARQSSRANKGCVKSTHCIVLDLETAPGNASSDGAEQISNVSVLLSVRKENEFSAQRLQSKGKK